MRLTITFLLVFLLTVTAEDAYTACKCVRRRMFNRTCPGFIRHAVPQCAPGAPFNDCEDICCAACLMYGDAWPICRSAKLRTVCMQHTPEPDQLTVPGPQEPYPGMEEKADEEEEHDDDHDDDYYDDHDRDGPKEQLEGLVADPSEQPDLDNSPEPDGGLEPEGGLEVTSTPEEVLELEPTPVAAGTFEPPFDATEEGELDLAPAHGRPFAPAACECMIKGASCDAVLAAASGVCKPGVSAASQGEDCHFACCRVCIVNMYASYCDDPNVIDVCAL